ncbi:hypothetical protein VTG60DRAFT_4320 [Thermothelomyces hinnuleus]
MCRPWFAGRKLGDQLAASPDPVVGWWARLLEGAWANLTMEAANAAAWYSKQQVTKDQEWGVLSCPF